MRTPATLAAAALLAGCGGPGRNPRPGPIATPVVAQAWLTTPDASRLLARQPDAPFRDAPPDGATTIAVWPDSSYQSMVGFGASLTDASTYLIQQKLSPAAREALLRELFGRDHGIGLSFTRLDMGASDFSRTHYSYADVPAGQADPALASFTLAPDSAETIPVVQRALAINPQLTVMATPWSAPAWMKTTGSLIKGQLRPEYHGAYAEYFRRFIRGYEAAGIPIRAITIQNEPHFEPDDYPGMRIEPAQRAAFIGQHLGPLLRRDGIATRILDWDHNWDQPESPLAVLGDATARPYVAGVAWHCYGGDVGAQAKVHDAHPDKDAYFTECSGGGWSPDFGENLKWQVRNLVIGATRNWARGVLLWNMALDEQHGPRLGGCTNCRGVVTIDSRTGAVTRNVEYWVLGHASRFVRPGAVRIGSQSGVQGIETVAFRNADDGSKVLLALNTGAAERTIAVHAGARWFSFAMPAGSVATFTWE